MSSPSVVFWEVDTQADFMLPGGALYVPGAEKRIPNIKRLVGAAREGRVFLVSDACRHMPNDPEFKVFPPHCVRGTPGARIISEGLAEKFYTVPNLKQFDLPADFSAKYQQVILEKQTLDVFDNPQADVIVGRLGKGVHYAIFGVVTEYCVALAAKGLLRRGCRVSIIKDAIETLDPLAGKKTLDELTAIGAKLITTDQALALLPPPAAPTGFSSMQSSRESVRR